MRRRLSHRCAPPSLEQTDLPIRSNFTVAAVVSVVTTAMVAFFVFIYGHYAGNWVTGLNKQIGEVVASEAAALAAMGDVDAALERYQEALAVKFDDPKQRFWTLRRYGELLLNDGRTSQATRALEECLSLNPKDSITLGLLARALRADGQFTQMAEVARRWVGSSREAGQPSTEAVAGLYLGEALEKLGDTDGALEAYLAGVKAQPDSDCAYHAAVLLDGRGRHPEALAVLEAYIPHATGWRAESAAKLRRALQDKAVPR